MSEDQVRVRTPIFSIGFSKKDHSFVIKEGQTIIMRVWKWKRLGYMKKAVTLKNGKIEVQVID